MILVSIERINKFIATHPRGSEAAGQLRSWYHEAGKAQWNNPQHLQSSYPKARPVGQGVVIFNIKGNHFRLVTRINYQTAVVSIEWIGTHTEYDKIKVEEVTWKE
jgi:mRNA interferase HigB